METPTAIQPTSTSLGNPSETVRLEKKTGYGMVTSTAMTVWSGNWADDAVNKPMLEYLVSFIALYYYRIHSDNGLGKIQFSNFANIHQSGAC